MEKLKCENEQLWLYGAQCWSLNGASTGNLTATTGSSPVLLCHVM